MAFADFRDWLSANSQHVMNSIRAVVGAMIVFDLIHVTDVQLVALYGMFETIFQTITAKTTISATRVDTIVNKRVNDILTPIPSSSESPEG